MPKVFYLKIPAVVEIWRGPIRAAACRRQCDLGGLHKGSWATHHVAQFLQALLQGIKHKLDRGAPRPIWGAAGHTVPRGKGVSGDGAGQVRRKVI